MIERHPMSTRPGRRPSFWNRVLPRARIPRSRTATTTSETPRGLKPAAWVWSVVAATILVTQTGCLTGPEFRAAALPAMESGVEQILDGLVDGIFAAIEPETSTEEDTE